MALFLTRVLRTKATGVQGLPGRTMLLMETSGTVRGLARALVGMIVTGMGGPMELPMGAGGIEVDRMLGGCRLTVSAR